MSKAVDWSTVFEQYKASGQTMQLFCKANQIAYTQFRYRWYRQRGLVANKEVFEPVQVIDSIHQIPPIDKGLKAVTIRLPNQIECDIKETLSAPELFSLLERLARLC
jgi:primase-polymerase (primpol)-like protein